VPTVAFSGQSCLQECSGSTTKKIESFFEDLIDEKLRLLDSFLKNCNDALARLKAQLQLQLPVPNERTSAQSTSLQTGLGATSFQKTTDRQERIRNISIVFLDQHRDHT
jgi:hypothetical protein